MELAPDAGPVVANHAATPRRETRRRVQRGGPPQCAGADRGAADRVKSEDQRVVASHAFLEVAARQRAAHYSNLGEHFAAEERGETPFTPPVQATYAFHEALGETLDEGVPHRIAHYGTLMRLMQQRLAAMSVKFLLPVEGYGRTLISCELPAGHSYDALHRAMKQQGFVIYAAQGALKPRAFRLGLIGHFGIAEVTAFLDALEAHLRS